MKFDFRNTDIKNVVPFLTPKITDGYYEGTYGGDKVVFKDIYDIAWVVTTRKAIKGFGYVVTVEVKNGEVVRIYA